MKVNKAIFAVKRDDILGKNKEKIQKRIFGVQRHEPNEKKAKILKL